MAQTLYDDRLDNIKTWPDYHTVNYAEQLEEDDNENRVSDHNYVICVKKPPDERAEKFYNGNIPDSLDNYIRRINASYFMTVDNLTKDIWADDSDSIEPSETKSPPPYVPNTYAIRRIVNKSIWNSMSTTATSPDFKYHNIASSGAVQDLLVSNIWSKNKTVSKYNKNTSYAVGDECLYNNTCYRCIVATRGEWTPSHWREINTVESTGYNLFVPNVYAIQNIIKTEIYPSSVYSNDDQVIPTVGAIKDIITSSSGIILNPLILPNDNKHVPTNATVNNALNSALNSVSSKLYSDGVIYYNSGTNTYYINPNYAQDNTHFITAAQMYLLGYNRWWS